MKAVTLCLLALFGIAVASTPASADLTFTFTCQSISQSGVVCNNASNFGNVVLHQDGSNVDVTVTLVSGENFIQSGTHETFTFDLGDKPVTTVDVPTGFTWVQPASEQGNPGFNGPFDYQINCNDGFMNCTHPGSSTIGGPETFVVHGVQVSDFVAAADGTFFSADIFSANLNNQTGVIGVRNPGVPTAVPEPASLALLGTGLASLAGVVRRKLRK